MSVLMKKISLRFWPLTGQYVLLYFVEIKKRKSAALLKFLKSLKRLSVILNIKEQEKEEFPYIQN